MRRFSDSVGYDSCNNCWLYYSYHDLEILIYDTKRYKKDDRTIYWVRELQIWDKEEGFCRGAIWKESSYCIKKEGIEVIGNIYENKDLLKS